MVRLALHQPGAATHLPLLRRLHEVALGRITFVEFAFVPRKGIAPWLLAAMRLAPLLDLPFRTVVTTDIHDELPLQNAQIHSLLGRLRREGKDLCLTWWLAEDGAEDCLIDAALPVPKCASTSPTASPHLRPDGGRPTRTWTPA